MNAGDTFRLVNRAERHLWAIISDPRIDPARVLFVNFTTRSPNVDQTVTVPAGCHPEITQASCVNYPRARCASDAQLQQLLAAGMLALRDPLSAPLLQQIRYGAGLSEHITIDHLQLLQAQGLVAP